MTKEQLKLMNLLPLRIGEALIDAAYSVGIEPLAANSALGGLLDRGLADLDAESQVVLTDKGQGALARDKVSSEMTALQQAKDTEKIATDVLWKDGKTFIHPAITFAEDTAYIVQFLPFKSEDATEMKPVLITSGRKMMHLDALPDNLQMLQPPLRMDPPMWDIGSIKEFIDGVAPVPSFKEVFDEIKALVSYYMDFTETPAAYDFIPIWDIGTYFHQLFDTYPYQFLNAAKRSGKSKCLTLQSLLAFNGKSIIKPSEASFFRMIQGLRCTLCIDEIETAAHADKELLRTVLLSGYKKGSKVPRSEEVILPGKKGVRVRVIEEYDVFSPKIMANIAGMERVLEDRCIPLILVRSDNLEKLNRIVSVKDPRWQALRNRLYALMLMRWKEVDASYRMFNGIFAGERPAPAELVGTVEKIKKNVSSRYFELWVPIFALTHVIDSGMLPGMVDFAIETTRLKEQLEYEETFESNVIQALIYNISETGWHQSAQTVKDMQTYEGLEKLTTQALRKALSRLKISNQSKKEAGKIWFYIDLGGLRDVARKFNVPYDELRQETHFESAAPTSHSDIFFSGLSKFREKLMFTKEDLFKELGGIPLEKKERLFEEALTKGLVFEPRAGKYQLAG